MIRLRLARLHPSAILYFRAVEFMVTQNKSNVVLQYMPIATIKGLSHVHDDYESADSTI